MSSCTRLLLGFAFATSVVGAGSIAFASQDETATPKVIALRCSTHKSSTDQDKMYFMIQKGRTTYESESAISSSSVINLLTKPKYVSGTPGSATAAYGARIRLSYRNGHVHSVSTEQGAADGEKAQFVTVTDPMKVESVMTEMQPVTSLMESARSCCYAGEPEHTKCMDNLNSEVPIYKNGLKPMHDWFNHSKSVQ